MLVNADPCARLTRGCCMSRPGLTGRPRCCWYVLRADAWPRDSGVAPQGTTRKAVGLGLAGKCWGRSAGKGTWFGLFPSTCTYRGSLVVLISSIRPCSYFGAPGYINVAACATPTPGCPRNAGSIKLGTVVETSWQLSQTLAARNRTHNDVGVQMMGRKASSSAVKLI